jgi:hypothetical protein
MHFHKSPRVILGIAGNLPFLSAPQYIQIYPILILHAWNSCNFYDISQKKNIFFVMLLTNQKKSDIIVIVHICIGNL